MSLDCNGSVRSLFHASSSSLRLQVLPEAHFKARHMTQSTHNTRLTRRTILGGASALAIHAITPHAIFGAEETKPNSVFGGVRIGCITYSYRGGPDTAEYTLE